MKNLTKGIFILVIFLTIVFDSKCKAEHLLRTGKLNLTSERSLIIVGIASRGGHRLVDLDFESLGFKGRGLNHLDPKFLIEIYGNDVQDIFAFDMEPSLVASSDKKQKLTNILPLLINSKAAKKYERNHVLGNILVGFGKSLGFPFSPLAIQSRIKHLNRESIRRMNATYLIELIRHALPPQNVFPELIEAFSDLPATPSHYLGQLGQALITRFNPRSNWAGLHVPSGQTESQNETESFFLRWSHFNMKKQSENQELLNDNLSVLTHLNIARIHSVQNSYAFVSINLNSDQVATILNSTDAKALNQFIALHRNLTQSGNTTRSELWVPWCLISFFHPKGAINLLEFQYPGEVGIKVKKLREKKILLDRIFSLLPFTHLAVKSIRKFINDEALKSGNTESLDRAQAFGSTLALLETRAYPPPLFNDSDLDFKSLSQALRKIGVIDSTGPRHKSTILNDASFQLVSNEENKGRLEEAPSQEELSAIKFSYFENLKNYLSENVVLNETTASTLPKPIHPTLLFFIDGLRPDRFKQAAREGIIPTLSGLFYSRGTEIESYTPRSLTLPSWSTILTGYESDMHGIRSNAPISRSNQTVTDFLNPVMDFIDPINWQENRAFHRNEEDKTGTAEKIWLASYFNKNQTLYNYLPIVRGANVPVKELISDLLSKRAQAEYTNGLWFPASILDRASARKTAKMIEGDKNGNLRLVMNWYSAIDEAQHHNNESLVEIYRDIDKAVSEVIQAAAKHPILKNATVFLISDHGHSSGFGPFDENSTLYQIPQGSTRFNEGPLLSNSGFNLTEFLSGNFPKYNYYEFALKFSNQVVRKQNLSWLDEYFLPPLQWGSLFHWSKPTAMIDYAGSNLAQIYLKRDTDWKKRFNFFELTHLSVSRKKNPVNLVTDFLEFEQSNFNISDIRLSKRLREISNNHPVQLVAVPISDEISRKEIDQLGGNKNSGESTRDPVVVISQGKWPGESRFGIILTRSNAQGQDWFRYLVIKNFSQDVAGHITGTLSSDPSDDPLRYLGRVPKTEDFSVWKSDSEWLNLARYHEKPTAIFSLARTLTLALKYTDPDIRLVSDKVKTARMSETPDFILISNPGYAFHHRSPIQSDHGGLMREEVRNTFIISSLDKSQFPNHQQLDAPHLTRDIMATVLDYAGAAVPLIRTQGESLKVAIDSIQ